MTIQPITSETPINVIVNTYPETLPVLQQFGIDTCCGGALPLQEVADRHALALPELMQALQDVLPKDQAHGTHN